MDYFNELLDSYNKLKKRSFKLRYISEADTKKAASKAPAKTPEQKEKEEDGKSLEKAKGVADQYITNAPQVPSDPVGGETINTTVWVQANEI